METHSKELLHTYIAGSVGAAMATSGEFRFLTLGLLLVVVGLTRAEIATCKELTLRENKTLSVSPEITRVQKAEYVYLIEEGTRHGDRRYFKVGMTISPISRLKILQAGNPRRLIMRKYKVKNKNQCERTLKVNLQQYKSKLGGGTEWFIVLKSQVPIFKTTFIETIKKEC